MLLVTKPSKKTLGTTHRAARLGQRESRHDLGGRWRRIPSCRAGADLEVFAPALWDGQRKAADKMTAWWFQVWAHFQAWDPNRLAIVSVRLPTPSRQKWLVISRFIRLIAHLNMLHFHIYYYLLLGWWNMMKQTCFDFHPCHSLVSWLKPPSRKWTETCLHHWDWRCLVKL